MQSGWIRIIAGKWRGRRLKIVDEKTLRPTPDRIRETLFNWLAPIIPGARCLDLFAGTGALGFEALSRGAIHAELVDQSRSVVTALQTQAELLAAENVTIYAASIPQQLNTPQNQFHVVFIDPPYQSNLLISTCEYLEKHKFLVENAYIYLEAGRVIEDNELPKNWQIIKAKQAGSVFYHLAIRK